MKAKAVKAGLLIGIIGLVLGMLSSAASANHQIIRAATCSTYMHDQADSVVASRQSPGGVLYQSNNHYQEGYCRVDVPQGACIRHISAYGADDTIFLYVFRLLRAQYCAEAHTVIAEWTSTNNGPSPSCVASEWRSAPLAELVNNQTRTYWIHFLGHPLVPGTDLRLWNLEVHYEMTTTCAL